MLTGDTLFIGDVGRPDLSPRHTPAQLAGMLYDSLHNKLLTLADNVLVYPGARRGLAVRKEYAGRAVVHDRDRAVDQLCAADQEQGRVRRAADQQSSGAAGIFSEGCGDQSHRRGSVVGTACRCGRFSLRS